VDAPAEHAHRGLADIRAILERGQLPARARERALAVFARLADAEARIHGIPVEAVHFHEVGALDAIVDVAGACLGFELLGVSGFYATPFTFGSGTVRAQHGQLAVPVPATVALTEGFPSRRTALPGELVTPTGAAIITALARPLPEGFTATLSRAGYGAGSRDLPGIANVLRLCLMHGAATDDSGYAVFQVECNLDNMAPELIGYAAERLLASGCKDVWQEPIHMKKSRSAVKLCALADRASLETALTVIAAETATGGVRWFPVQRLVAEKAMGTVATSFGEVEVKRVSFPGRAAPRWSPEFESCRKLAVAKGVPLQDVYREALTRAAGMAE
jgi:pyridinium-3,5-bisthiocarboxylic acid mononucleotide nickel chelatase